MHKFRKQSIEDLLKIHGETKTDMGRRLNKNHSHVNAWLKTGNMNITSLIQIANEYKVKDIRFFFATDDYHGGNKKKSAA